MTAVVQAHYTFGDVIPVSFPFTDQTTTKRRPAVVVSSLGYNAQRPDVILLAITSQARAAASFGESLVGDWQAAGLVKPSLFKPLIATVEQALVVKRFGRLSANDVGALRAVIGEIIG
jgi:mRNA interferase MazF